MKTLNLPGPREGRGFTLIELMIAVAIVAILAAVALPSYTSYVMRSKRADAKNALLDLAAREERFFSINNAYTNDPVKLGYGAGTTFPIQVAVSGGNNYELSVTVPTGNMSFTAKAAPKGSQVKDTKCYAYQVDQQGTRSNLNSSGTSLSSTGCW